MARNGLQSFFETLVRGLIIGVVGATSLIIVILVLVAVFQPSFGSR
jgi:tetrahydromethanopterin S-methyltransferase subunit F